MTATCPWRRSGPRRDGRCARGPVPDRPRAGAAAARGEPLGQRFGDCRLAGARWPAEHDHLTHASHALTARTIGACSRACTSCGRSALSSRCLRSRPASTRRSCSARPRSRDERVRGERSSASAAAAWRGGPHGSGRQCAAGGVPGGVHDRAAGRRRVPGLPRREAALVGDPGARRDRGRHYRPVRHVRRRVGGRACSPTCSTPRSAHSTSRSCPSSSRRTRRTSRGGSRSPAYTTSKASSGSAWCSCWRVRSVPGSSALAWCAASTRSSVPSSPPSG
jgi:hypothetical protein